MIFVPEAELTVGSGETLRRYTFGTGTAQHFFCSTCGIYTHHRARSNPQVFAVNVGTVEGIDIRAVSHGWVDGVHHPSDRLEPAADNDLHSGAGAAGED